MDTALQTWVEVPAHLRCRLLFGSPVCVLFTRNPPSVDVPENSTGHHHLFNAMTVSWLTAIDNHRRFFLSINAGRHTLTNLIRDHVFTLSVAVEGMEDALLSFGSMSGRSCLRCSEDSDAESAIRPRCKYTEVLRGQPWVSPGTTDAWHATAASVQLAAHGSSPAHLQCRVCTVLSAPPDSLGGTAKSEVGSVDAPLRGAQHVLLECEIDAAFVKQSYWHMGKIFGALPESRQPALLAFAGTKRFATITLAPFGELECSSTGKRRAEPLPYP